MPALNATLRGHLQELKTNKRLQLGGLGIFLMLCVEIGMSWSDRLARQTAELNQLRTEIISLRQQSQNEAYLRETLTSLQALQREVGERLWQVSSEAVGQAKVKDWINETLVRVGINNATISIATPRRAVSEKSAASTTHPSENRLLEFRATIGLGFSPESLENLLAELEAGEPFIGVNSLTVNKQTRRVEIGIHLLMQLPKAEANSKPEGAS